MSPHTGARFVGRSTELALVDRSLDAAFAGSPALVLVTGEPGIGKTRLADAIARRAAARRAEVAWGRAWEFGGAPAFWPWAQVLRAWAGAPAWPAAVAALGAAAGELARIDPELPGVPPAPDAGDPERARVRLFRAVGDVVRALAAAAPRVAILDDVHAADAPSLLLLRFLVRELGGAPIAVVATFRDVQADPTEEVRALLAALGRDGRRIALGGLGEHDVGQLVHDALGASPTGLVRGLRDATGGNPFYLQEVLATVALDPAAVDPARIAAPPGVRDAVELQVAHLGDDVRTALAAAAVIGRPAPPALIAEVAARPEPEILAALDRARGERVLVDADEPGCVTFAHALFREVVYQGLPSAARAAAHRRAGEALARGPDPDARAAELARHFAAAVELGEAARAIDHAARAGARATRHGAYEDAVVHLDAARRLAEAHGAPPEVALDVELALGEAHLAAGQRPRAAERFRAAAVRAAERGDPRALARAAIGAARCVEFVTRDPAAIELLERAEAAVAAAEPDGPLHARVLAQLAVALWMDPRARDRRDALGRRAVAIARAHGDPGLLAIVLNARLQALAGPDNLDERLAAADEILDVARAAGDLERVADALRWRAGALLELGDVARADLDLDAYARLAEELRLPFLAINAVMRRGLRAMMAGRWHEAEALIARTHERSRAAADPGADIVRACATAAVAIELGRHDVLAAQVPVLAGEADRLRWGLFIHAQLARALATLGRHDEARAQLARVVEDDFARLPRDFVHVATLALIAEVAIALGDRAVCARARELLAPYAGRNVTGAATFAMGSSWRYLGRLAAALGDRDEARALLERAAAHDRAMGAWPAVVHDLAELAVVLAGDGDPRAAAIADDAVARARALGMAPEVARLEALVVAEGDAGPAPAPAIAELARSGETWTIAVDGRTITLRDRRGLGYLARLLAEPGRALHVLDLAAPDAPAEARAAADGLPALDARAKAAYRARLEALRERAEEAEARGDLACAAQARDELDTIAAELARALGLGGRDRRTGGAAERARSAVTLAIRRAIAAIAEVAPDLGRHLELSVKTGVFCSYAPDPRAALAWRVTT